MKWPKWKRKNEQVIDEVPNFKILLVGAERVGKTSLFKRYLTNQFTTETKADASANIGIKLTELRDMKKATTELWDLPHKVYMDESICREYIQDAHGVVFIYSLDDVSSVDVMKQYYSALKMQYKAVYGGVLSIPSIVMGNKHDKREKRRRDSLNTTEIVKLSASDWAQRTNLPHYCVSAKDNTGISQALKDLLQMMLIERD